LLARGTPLAVALSRGLSAWGCAILSTIKVKGVLIRSPSMRGVAEEAPKACKDVTAVVDAADHAGLSRKVVQLKPLACIKG